MSTKDIIDVISAVGFPIFITIYLLSRWEKRIDKLTETLQEVIILLKKRFDFETK